MLVILGKKAKSKSELLKPCDVKKDVAKQDIDIRNMRPEIKVFVTVSSVAVGIVGGLLLLFYNQDFFQENESFYKNRAAVESSGASTIWLPKFVPQSAFDIHEKHNIDYGTGIIKFSFLPSEFQTLAQSLRPVTEEDSANIRPSWVYREKWFSNSIIDGKFEELKKSGFELYWLNEGTRHSEDRKWFLAINQKTGIAYAWNVTSRS